MKTSHVLVGGVPAALLVGLAATLTKGRIHLTTDEAVFYGGLALAAGTGLVHRIEKVGIKGLFSGVWSGQAPTEAPPAK